MPRFKGSIERMGEVEETYKGANGSWQEPAEAPFVTYAVEMVRLFLVGGDFTKEVIMTGDHVTFDAGQDEGGYDGEGEGDVTMILEVGYGDVVVILTNGFVTYTGPTPPQSQKGACNA